MQWTAEHVPAEERTTVREDPDAERLGSLSEEEARWLRILLDRLPDDLDLDAATSLVYGVPKVGRGLGLDDPPTDQVKADQKDFFRLLYQLLVSAERGPRLPTLVVALGPEKVRRLLGG
jgi:lysyl-tRNA synthetase, class I